MQEQNRQDSILETLTSYWTDRAKSYSAQNIAEMNCNFTIQIVSSSTFGPP